MPDGLTKAEHVRLAQMLEHPDDDYAADLPKGLSDVLLFEVEFDTSVDDFRDEVM